MTLSALVVGLGRMGTFHARVLRDLGYTVHTVDPDPEKGADYPSIAEAVIGTEHSALPWQHVDPARRRFDIAAIATPAEHLLDSAYQLAGIPMLVEKPFALTSRDARMLGVYLEQKGSRVCVGYVERFNPRVRNVQVSLSARRPRKVRFTRWSDRPSWNTALDLTSHDIDLALEFEIPLDRCEFDAHADCGDKVRRIDVAFSEEAIAQDAYDRFVDLMDHSLSPLHALWHAFLTGKPVPTPEQAARVLQVIEHMETRTEEEIAA